VADLRRAWRAHVEPLDEPLRCLPEDGSVVVVLHDHVVEDNGGMARPLVDAVRLGLTSLGDQDSSAARLATRSGQRERLRNAPPI